MARLDILAYPDPRLRMKALPVREFDDALARLIDDLFETLYAARGIGLAATQVNVQLLLIVIDVSEDRSKPEVFINPQILARDQIGLVEESCLSVPGIVENVARATALTVRAVDRRGTPYMRDLDGLLAVCLQHEIDHLDGTLFVDRLPFFKRLRTRRRLERGGRAYQAAA